MLPSASKTTEKLIFFRNELCCTDEGPGGTYNVNRQHHKKGQESLVKRATGKGDTAYLVEKTAILLRMKSANKKEGNTATLLMAI